MFPRRNRKSALGTYSIDPNGDVTLRDYGAYRIRDGEIEFAESSTRRPPRTNSSGGASSRRPQRGNA
jgi:hypothetical protein